MRWQTEIEISPLTKRICYKDKILCLGSCFAAEIGSQLKDLRFDITVNPFGTLFNPASIALSLGRMDEKSHFLPEDVIQREDLFVSFNHSSEFSAFSKEEFLSNNNRLLDIASDSFVSCSWVIITLGTARIYREKKSGRVVTNCHKFPDSYFSGETLEPDEIYSLLNPYIKTFQNKNWIITVSPVRHLKDGAHRNQLSKARLLLATERLIKENSNAYYFPSYELFIDELRDYRFYSSDMVHPSKEAIKYIWERFKEYAIDKSCEKIIRQAEELNNLKNHKVLMPGTIQHKRLESKILSLEESLTAALKRHY